jgi:UDP-GlcNAc:undecaprenyl-phosphate GlcNAc-1-phosphate transferase
MFLAHYTLFATSFGLSLLLTWQVRGMANRYGWVRGPDDGHHIHQRAVPRLGGIAIFLAFLAANIVLLAAPRLFQVNIGFNKSDVLSILLPGTLVFLIGLYDDFRSVNPWLKLGTQSLAAILLGISGFGFSHVFLGHLHPAWIAQELLMILWVVVISNAFNLIDGIDGLAAGSALFSTVAVLLVSLWERNILVSLLAVGMAGALVGFLRFNFTPATIFLGDSGSLFVGFTLSALSLAGTQTQRSSTLAAVAIPLVAFGLPIADTTLAVIRRFLNGRPVFSADREHIHHKLLQKGFTQRQAVIVLYGVSGALGLLSLLLLSPNGKIIAIALLVVGIGVCLGVQSLGYSEFFALERAARRTIRERQTIMNDLAFRRATESIEHVSDFEQILRELKVAFGTSDFDGFQLVLDPAFCTDVRTGTSSPSSPNGFGKDFSWTRKTNGNCATHEVEPGWKLTLELVTPTRGKQGQLQLYRVYQDRPLLVDLNFLTTEFQAALAGAIDRTVGGQLLQVNRNQSQLGRKATA